MALRDVRSGPYGEMVAYVQKELKGDDLRVEQTWNQQRSIWLLLSLRCLNFGCILAQIDNACQILEHRNLHLYYC